MMYVVSGSEDICCSGEDICIGVEDICSGGVMQGKMKQCQVR